MRLQPKDIHPVAGRSGHQWRPVRLSIGRDLIFDMSADDAHALADALHDAAELSQENR